MDDWELFDLAADPREHANLDQLPGHQETIRRLTARLYRLREQLGDC